MEVIILDSIVVLAVLGFVAWLGGGRKWAFRTLLSVLILASLATAATLLYTLWSGKSTERHMQKIHECAVAKVADPKCETPPTDPNEPRFPARTSVS